MLSLMPFAVSAKPNLRPPMPMSSLVNWKNSIRIIETSATKSASNFRYCAMPDCYCTLSVANGDCREQHLDSSFPESENAGAHTPEKNHTTR